jgi:hypothetical protein
LAKNVHSAHFLNAKTSSAPQVIKQKARK